MRVHKKKSEWVFRRFNPASVLISVHLIFSGAACLEPRSNLKVENDRIMLSAENVANNFHDVLVEIEANRSGEKHFLDFTFQKRNWQAERKQVPAPQFDFYRQAVLQEINPDAFKDWRESGFQKKSPGLAYGLAATLPEAMPFYLKSGDFELHNSSELVLESLVFLFGDLGAAYYLLDEEVRQGFQFIVVFDAASTFPNASNRIPGDNTSGNKT